MSPPPLHPSTFATTQLSLLAADLAAESASTTALLATHSPKTLAKAGLAVVNLVLAGRRTGAGGRTVLELERDGAVAAAGGEGGGEGGAGVRVGDVVRVAGMRKGGERRGEGERGVEGVVVRVGGAVAVAVAVGEGGGEEGGEGLEGRLWV